LASGYTYTYTHLLLTLFLYFPVSLFNFSGEEWCHPCAVWEKKDGKNIKIIPVTNWNNKKRNTKKKTENEITVSPSFSPSYSPLFSPGFSSSISPSLTPHDNTKNENLNYSRKNNSPEKKEIIIRKKYILVGRDRRCFVVFGLSKYVHQQKARRAVVKWNR
jgi:hypothetical protein